jgi:hypothetical protein
MNKIILILIACVFNFINTKAQSIFWNSPHAYLNQTPPSDTPKIFAPDKLVAVNDTGIALDRVAFSPDGKEFYYCYNTKWFSSENLKIKYFRHIENEWRGPFILNEHFDSPAFSVDGNTL